MLPMKSVRVTGTVAHEQKAMTISEVNTIVNLYSNVIKKILYQILYLITQIQLQFDISVSTT